MVHLLAGEQALLRALRQLNRGAAEQYNDIRVLSRHYEQMRQYVAYLTTIADPDTGLVTFHKYGDWCADYPRTTGKQRLPPRDPRR